MKIRQGFVSNSSSTSFCIYGAFMEDASDFNATVRQTVEELGLYYHYGQFDGVYIGREWSSIGDDETGREFKESVQERIDDLPIEDKECSTHEDGWYDG